MSLLINGRFLTRPATGVERYGRMLLHVISSEWPDARVLVPGSYEGEVDACGLQVIRHGRSRGHVWEQMELPRAVGKGDVLLSPANTGPLRGDRHVPVIHDLAFLHHPEWFNTRFATWYKLLIPRMVRRAERVITVSGSVQEEVIRYFGVDRKRMHVVPPFVIPSLVNAPFLDTGIDRPYYLIVASLDPRKGLDRVFNWYTSLQQPEFDLVIVGRSHRAFAETAIPVHLGIHVLGDVDDVLLAALYKSAIALVQASYYEGFGLPIMEAHALDCPVIAAELPVFHEQFGEAPFYADIGFTRSMMRAMITMSKADDRAIWVAKGRVASTRFDVERTTTALHLALDQLLGE